MRANVEHNRVVNQNVAILSIKNERVPHIADSDRLVSDNLGDREDRITCLTARIGFQDDTDVPATLRQTDRLGLLEGSYYFDNLTYFLSQITIVPGDTSDMSRWRKHLFLTMAHNAASPVEYFRLPDNRTITIGERIQL